MKGFFTQGLAILLREPLSIAEARTFLEGFDIAKENPASENWELRGPSGVIRYRPDVNGYVALDTIGRPWPDGMGDPKADPMLFTSWSTGHFGPFAYPGGLRRALEQAWSWPGAAESVNVHAAFLRLKMSYLFGADRQARVGPENYDPRPELEFLGGVGRALLAHPSAICWFSASGELVLPRSVAEERWASAQKHEVPALNLWTNVRLFNLPDGWLAMDTVGNGQLDAPDLEAIFRKDTFDPGEVDVFLRNVTNYLVESRATIADGDTVAGPAAARSRGYSFET